MWLLRTPSKSLPTQLEVCHFDHPPILSFSFALFLSNLFYLLSVRFHFFMFTLFLSNFFFLLTFYFQPSSFQRSFLSHVGTEALAHSRQFSAAYRPHEGLPTCMYSRISCIWPQDRSQSTSQTFPGPYLGSTRAAGRLSSRRVPLRPKVRANMHGIWLLC